MRRLISITVGALLLLGGALAVPTMAQAAPGDPTIALSALGSGGETGTGAFLLVSVLNSTGFPAHAAVGTTITLPTGLEVVTASPSNQCNGTDTAGQLQIRSTTPNTVTLQGNIGATVTGCSFVIVVTGTLPGTYQLCGPAVFTDPVGLEPTAACSTLAYVDTTPPAAPVITSPTPGATEKASFVVEGTSEAGTTVRITSGTATLCEAVATGAGRFSCTVTGQVDGPFELTPTATDPSDNATTGAPVSVTVDTRVAPVFTTTRIPAATVGSAYDFTLVAPGTPTPAFTVTAGRLPAGVTLEPATGRLSGTPTQSGTFAVTFSATNSVGADALRVSFVVAAAAVTPPAVAPPAPAASSGSPELAMTGSSPMPLAVGGLALLLVGAALLAGRRKAAASER